MSPTSSPQTTTPTQRIAVIVGGSSGIGEALARRLHRQGWSLVIMGRRRDRLDTIADSLGSNVEAVRLDLTEVEQSRRTLSRVLDQAEVKLVCLSSGVGNENPGLQAEIEEETLAVNVVGFTLAAGIAYRAFAARSEGHIVAITSIAAIRASGPAASYSASKAYQSVYLDGIRSLARSKNSGITVTEIQPGFVDTAMMKAEKPFWISSADKAADQIMTAINKKKAHAYVSRRWGVIAFALRLLPRPR